jgi:serine/threonine-protein kinase RsbW
MSESKSGVPRGEKYRPGVDALPSGMLRVPARPSYLALVGAVVRWFGREAGLNEEQCQELEVAVDEACSNVIRYAFPEAADGEMTVVCSASETGLEVTIQDRGKLFDPEEGVQIAREKRSRDPASGGMGLLLIDELTDAVRYRWDEREGNRLTLVKYK